MTSRRCASACKAVRKLINLNFLVHVQFRKVIVFNCPDRAHSRTPTKHHVSPPSTSNGSSTMTSTVVSITAKKRVNYHKTTQMHKIKQTHRKKKKTKKRLFNFGRATKNYKKRVRENTLEICGSTRTRGGKKRAPSLDTN